MNEKCHAEKYKELELEKWKILVQLPCEARVNNEMISDLCLISEKDCSHSNCFALRIIKISKGFL